MRQETMLELRDLIWAYRHRLADRWPKTVEIAIVKIGYYLDADPVTLVTARLVRIERRVSGAAN